MINSITIVGGGTAGFVSALILQKTFGDKIKIRVVRSTKIGIIGVGEGSTEHWADFLSYINVEHKEVIKNVMPQLNVVLCLETGHQKIIFTMFQNHMIKGIVNKD